VRQQWLIWALFAAIMGFASGGSFVWGWNFIPTTLPSGHQHEIHSAETTKDAEGQPQGTVTAPFFVQVITSPKSAGERAQEEEDREEKKAADRWLVRWTFALFAATIGLIIATGVLGYFGFQQSRDMQASIGLSERSAKAAEAAVRVSEQHLISVERAFVYAKGHTVTAINDANGTTRTVALTIIWENSGSTPTRKAFNHLNVGSFTKELGNDFSFYDVQWGPEGRENTPIFLGPKAVLASNMAEIPMEELTDAAAGKAHIYVWGWVEYDDIFVGSPRHRTEFCFKVSPVDLATGKLRIDLHHAHNGADGDCFRKLDPRTNQYK